MEILLIIVWHSDIMDNLYTILNPSAENLKIHVVLESVFSYPSDFPTKNKEVSHLKMKLLSTGLFNFW